LFPSCLSHRRFWRCFWRPGSVPFGADAATEGTQDLPIEMHVLSADRFLTLGRFFLVGSARERGLKGVCGVLPLSSPTLLA
jgi:hypothetical protein